MSDQTSEFHVAQHSRRERLRINEIFQPYQHTSNISYDPSLVLSPEMLNFATSTESVLVPLSHSGVSNHVDRTSGGVTQNCGTWKSVNLQQQASYNWNTVANYNSNGGIESSLSSPMFVGREGNLSGSLNLHNVSTIDVKPINYFGYQEMQSPPFANSSTTNMQFSSNSVLYHDTLQEVVTSATVGTQSVETGRGLWTEDGNELLLLPNCVDQSNQLHQKNLQVERCHQWNSELGANLSAKATDNSNTQALALSLSPVPASKPNMVQVEKRNTISEVFSVAHRNAVPLGPFTGYATILKSSKFLRPAQQLLDELCNLAGDSNAIKSYNYSEKVREGIRVSCDIIAAESSSGAVGDSGGSSSSFYSSKIQKQECGGLCISTESNVRPDYLQKKAKLIYMQDEICRRYKQYHQQMQMVVSSFETVAGLSAATPHISLALRTVSQHFRSLRNSISDHLKNIRLALGEDLPSPAATGMNRGDGTLSRSNFIDQMVHKQKAASGGAGVSFVESQQHVWRPQRGLPEHAVSILRAWLFDHFLHPYPTDSDKHMLATKTGLTRNQVSNWFINARVRVWKPMVEEIHMLETRGVGETSSSVRKSDHGKVVSEQSDHVINDGLRRSNMSISNFGSQHLNGVLNNMSGGMLEKHDKCLGIGSSERLVNEDVWKNQEKGSRLECHIPATLRDGSFMGFIPYQRNGLEMGGGIGAVSLTLGLRQSAEAAQQQQQLQLHEHRLGQQFGGQMIHDFVD